MMGYLVYRLVHLTIYSYVSLEGNHKCLDDVSISNSSHWFGVCVIYLLCFHYSSKRSLPICWYDLTQHTAHRSLTGFIVIRNWLLSL